MAFCGLVTLVGAVPMGPVTGQTLTGRVVDARRVPLDGVTVTLVPWPDAERGAPRTTVSDSAGRFAFAVGAAGQYRLRARRIGYGVHRSAPLTLRGDDDVTVRLTLSAVPIPFEPLVVTASRRPWWEVLEPPGLWGFHERMARYGAAGRGRFFTRGEIEPWRGVGVARALGALLPFLRTEPDPRRPGQYLLRGPGRCRPTVFVDGRFVDLSPGGGAAGPREDLPLAMVVDAHALVAVEVYRGMSQAPPELTAPRFDSEVRCTVIGLWTRRR